MTPAQLRGIPGDLLYEKNTRGLREYLYARGTTLTLAELDAERRRRRERHLRPADPNRAGTSESRTA
jgi:hypothetical protein